MSDLKMENSRIDVAAATKNLITLYGKMEVEEQVNFYDSWAQDYEQHMSVMDYQAPRFGVETVDSVYLGDRENALVLDVPCGTGLVADGLQKLGFKNFHGIDGSERMLKIAESKGLYQRLTCWIVTSDNPLPIEPGSYDLVTIVGGLAQQHLPWDILPEMLRVTKPGGFICFTLRAEESDHRSKLLASTQELVNKGLWEKVVERYVENWQKDMLETGLSEEYADGVVAVYKKK
ncbi:methyltransferase-like protein 27 isoform X1 [Scyliorhinus canicula]|uniref:methyltransferase-like protein 27 isoform X1 n=2 Tax=Scyliorhinus canicula TaxID=7830 RepID=UPI0018F70BF6|nr:methyltransferase-like protein 27 isoform X1 [Scyliorhinus canicula]